VAKRNPADDLATWPVADRGAIVKHLQTASCGGLITCRVAGLRRKAYQEVRRVSCDPQPIADGVSCRCSARGLLRQASSSTI
jgi:hypothetical protein